MRETNAYVFRVSDGPTPTSIRVMGGLRKDNGTFAFDFTVPAGTPVSDVTDQLDTYATLADGFPAFLQDYLDDLEPCWGENGGRIMDRWGYALGPQAWVLEVQLAMADGQLRTLSQVNADYNDWPSVEDVHATVEELIGAFPASAPPSGSPWVPVDENDVPDPSAPRDVMTLALLNQLDDTYDAANNVYYTTVCGPPTNGADHYNRRLRHDLSVPSMVDWL